MNRYCFSEGDQRVEVDLNLPSGHSYPAPVTLGFHRIQRQYFSVIHAGEGDGWDTHRPCMSSIVMFQGKIYLIDTGPNILDSLTALGISVNEIQGIFQTHAHDDHFAGLTSLVRTDHRIAYYATPLVRSTIMKKLSAIMGLPEKRYQRTFEFHDLEEGVWNNIEGLEVKPVMSIHPVETTVLKFRSMWEGGYKTYVHLADIASWDVMKKIQLEHPKANDLSRQLYERITTQLLKPSDIKKIDIGGGMIHGDARDFSGDRSKKMVLAHIDRDLTTHEKEIGANVSFGQEDVLIPAHSDYVRVQAGAYLRSYFPQSARYDLHMLLNCPLVTFNSGVLIQRSGAQAKNVYLIVNGVAEVIQSSTGLDHMLSAGTLIGELEALGGDATEQTYRARSYVNALAIPAELYRLFIQRNADLRGVTASCEAMLFLQTTWLFGEVVSSPVLHRVVQAMELRSFDAGEQIHDFEEPSLYLMESGTARVLMDEREIEVIGRGDFFGEESIFFGKTGSLFTLILDESSRIFVIRGAALRDIPIIEWKIVETYERRLRAFGETLAQQ
jgi:hemerythrin